MNPSAWRGLTWALGAWIVAPVLIIAVPVFIGVVDRTMTTQNSEPSSVPTCRADDFYCAPIYDPSATAIFIQPASGEEDAAWTNILVELFSIVWVFGFVELVLLWLITWPRRAEPARLAEDDLGTQRLDRDVCFVTVVAIVGPPSKSTNHSPTGCFPSDYFCALTSNDGTTVSPTYVSMLGLIGFIVLGLIWLFTLQRSLTCPSCGQDLPEEQRFCGIVARNSGPRVAASCGTNAG